MPLRICPCRCVHVLAFCCTEQHPVILPPLSRNERPWRRCCMLAGKCEDQHVLNSAMSDCAPACCVSPSCQDEACTCLVCHGLSWSVTFTGWSSVRGGFAGSSVPSVCRGLSSTRPWGWHSSSGGGSRRRCVQCGKCRLYLNGIFQGFYRSSRMPCDKYSLDGGGVGKGLKLHVVPIMYAYAAAAY